ncbi:NACHT, LRR and PYD domains-containing protein 12 isoform 1-T1 [Synchiropus picturatus]
MDKNYVDLLQSKNETSTLLGGEQLSAVLANNKYISPLTSKGSETSDSVDLDQAIHSGLNGDNKMLIIVGSEGSGKTLALNKVIVDWAKGEHLQNFSHVFRISLKDICLAEEELSLEMLLARYQVPVESALCVLQKPEELLFIMDDLDQFRHSQGTMDDALSSDPKQKTSVSTLIASLLKGSLLKGASFLVASRPSSRVNLLSGTPVNVLGFTKHQKEEYFQNFYQDPSKAAIAFHHMERTVGFYDLSTSPRFLWSVCSVYQSLMDASEPLPETLSQLCACILVHLMKTQPQNQIQNREFILAIGRIALCCLSNQHLSCAKDQLDAVGLQLIPDSSLEDYLHFHGELLSFHSQLILEFVLALSVFLDEHEGVEKMLERLESNLKFLDLFLSGMSEVSQRSPLETLLGEFNKDQIQAFKGWFKTSSEERLKGCNSSHHARCFQLLHQTQNASLVKEIISPSVRMGIGCGKLSLQDYVGLNYVVSCLGQTDQLNLYRMRDMSGESMKLLVPAMSLSHKIILSSSSMATEAISLLASALKCGITTRLDLSYSPLDGDKFKMLCTGLRDSKIQTLEIPVCSLDEASCDFLVPVLTSASSQLCVLDMRANLIGNPGFAKLCQGLQSPNCRLQELQLQHCEVTSVSMETLAAVLTSGHSELRSINLTNNCVGDKGVETLCSSLQQPLCKLQSLNLFGAELTGACCGYLKDALMSQHCSLVELDLSLNELGQEGALLLCQALNAPGSHLEKLRMNRCELTQQVFEELGSLLKRDTTRLTSLSVGLNQGEDRGVKYILDAVTHPNCVMEELDLEMNKVTDASIDNICAALRGCKTLKSLELRNNSLTDIAVPPLVQAMQDSPHVLELNLKYNDFSEDVFEMMDECERIRY